MPGVSPSARAIEVPAFLLNEALGSGLIQAVEFIPGRISYRVTEHLCTLEGSYGRASKGDLLTREGAEFIFAAGPVKLDPYYN